MMLKKSRTHNPGTRSSHLSFTHIKSELPLGINFKSLYDLTFALWKYREIEDFICCLLKVGKLSETVIIESFSHLMRWILLLFCLSPPSIKYSEAISSLKVNLIRNGGERRREMTWISMFRNKFMQRCINTTIINKWSEFTIVCKISH